MRNETDSRNRFHRLGYTLRWRLESYSSVAKTVQRVEKTGREVAVRRRVRRLTAWGAGAMMVCATAAPA
jgi:hypothetical protein